MESAFCTAFRQAGCLMWGHSVQADKASTVRGAWFSLQECVTLWRRGLRGFPQCPWKFRGQEGGVCTAEWRALCVCGGDHVTPDVFRQTSPHFMTFIGQGCVWVRRWALLSGSI